MPRRAKDPSDSKPWDVSGTQTLGTSGSGEGVGPKIRELENSIEST